MTHPPSNGYGAPSGDATAPGHPMGPGPVPQYGPPPQYGTPPQYGQAPGFGPGEQYDPAMQWAPPQPWAPPPKPPTLPVELREYPAFWRAPGIRAWRPILAIVLAAIGFFLSSLAVSVAGLYVEAALSGRTIVDTMLELSEGVITPSVFFANSISLGLLIPLAFLLSRLVGQKGGWISSVVGRVRWRWLLKCFVISFIAVGAFIVLSAAVEGWDALELSAQPGWWWLLIGVLLVTPFQAAGEEYLIRGVLNRGVASLIPARLVGAVAGAVISSGVFMLLHGAGDIWLNITYFTMGMIFSYLTWRTGGLEAAVAMHAANNLVALMFLPFQDISDIFDREAGTGDPFVLLQLVLLGVAGTVIVIMARRTDIVRASAPAAGRPAPGYPTHLAAGGAAIS